MKIIIEIVLYNKKINDSTTFISLDNHKTIINQLFSQIELLIYDNSSTPQKFDIVNSFSVKYKSNKKNGGVSAAYNYAFDIAKKKAGIENFRYHDLRACFCTNALLSGWTIAQVSAVSGHKDWSQLKIYSRIKAEDLVDKINTIQAVNFNK